MKKVLVASAIALFATVSAQEYKPTAGDVTVDLGVAGGLGDTSIALADGGAAFKARYFKTDKFAYRVTVLLANNNTTANPTANTVTKDNDFSLGLGFGVEQHFTGTDKFAYRLTMLLANNATTTNPTSNIVAKDKDFSLGLGFGIEQHFTGTERLSPYVGGDILVGYASADTKSTFTPTNGSQIVTEVKGPNSFSAGVRGVFGADYYFAKRVFLGVEAGLSLTYSSEGDTKTKVTGLPETKVEGGNNFNISPAVVTGIRIGYAF